MPLGLALGEDVLGFGPHINKEGAQTPRAITRSIDASLWKSGDDYNQGIRRTPQMSSAPPCPSLTPPPALLGTLNLPDVLGPHHVSAELIYGEVWMRYWCAT